MKLGVASKPLQTSPFSVHDGDDGRERVASIGVDSIRIVPTEIRFLQSITSHRYHASNHQILELPRFK